MNSELLSQPGWAAAAATELNGQRAKDLASDGDRLGAGVMACRLSIRRMGQTKAIGSRDQAEVAEHFESSGDALTTKKKLFAPRQPEVAAIKRRLARAYALWRSETIPFEHGVRLVRRDRWENLQANVAIERQRLAGELAEADRNYAVILDNARAFIGEKLFSLGDYPAKFSESVTVDIAPVSIEPPEYMREFDPSGYRREQQRVRAELQATVERFEQDCREQFGELLEAITDKLTDKETGKRRVFREEPLKNLREFFDKFRAFNVRDDSELGELIDKADELLTGRKMASFKGDALLRAETREGLQGVVAAVKGVVAGGSRSIDLSDLDDI